MSTGAVLFDLLDKGFQKISEVATKVVGEETANSAQRYTASMGSIMDQSVGGRAIKNIVETKYHPTYDKYVKTYTQEATATGGKFRIDPNQPHSASNTIQATPQNIHKYAKMKATETAFGPRGVLVSGHLKMAQAENGSAHMQNIADALHMITQDSALYQGRTVSKLKTDLFRGYKAGANGEAIADKTAGIKNLNVDAIYQPQAKIETYLNKYANTILAPFIAIPHMATIGNVLSSTYLGSVNKGIAALAARDISVAAVIDRSNILADSMYRDYVEHYNYGSGYVAKLFKSQEAGYYINKVIHQPGFSGLRSFQVKLAGHVGYYSVLDSAREFAVSKGTSTWARANLEEMKFTKQELNQILQTGGQLTEDQKAKAVYHFVDSKIFLNNKLNRSLMSSANPWIRTASMFHGYVSSQAIFMKRELKKAIVSGNPFLMAQMLGTLGIAFPLMGEATKHLERYARGQFNADPNDENQNLIERYIDDYAHLGSFGIYTSYMRGLSNGKVGILSAAGGPIINSIATTSADAIAAVKGTSTGTHNFKPLERDFLEQSLPDHIGQFIAHNAPNLQTRFDKDNVRKARQKRSRKPKWEF